MRIAVCLKQVITPESLVRPTSDATWIREDTASWGMNEADGHALEEALRLKERHGGEVLAISAGPARAAQVLRDALARGADRAVHVDGDHLASCEAAITAAALAEVLRPEAIDLVLTGLQSDDQGSGQVGVLLAERLGAAHATIIVAVDVTGPTLRVKRELEGGWFQWIALPMPAVLAIQSGINEPRHATLKGMMAAKKKELRTIPAPAASAASQHVISLQLPVRARQARLFDGTPAEASESLVRALRDDANVI